MSSEDAHVASDRRRSHPRDRANVCDSAGAQMYGAQGASGTDRQTITAGEDTRRSDGHQLEQVLLLLVEFPVVEVGHSCLGFLPALGKAQHVDAERVE